MSEFKVGDLVEAVKGDTVIRGRLVETFGCGDDFWVGDSTKLLSGLPGCGWVVSLVEAAPEPLPVEPGLYQDSDGGDAWLLDLEGVWSCLTVSGYKLMDRLFGIDVASCAPFVRLEPVPETVKRVVDAVRTFAWADGFTNQLDRLEKDFGVAS